MQSNIHYQEYTKELKQKERELNQNASRCSRISFWRGISFITAVILFYFAYEKKAAICYLFAAATMLAFATFIRYHSQLKLQRKDLENDCAVRKDYLARFGNGWKDFSVDGDHYLKERTFDSIDPNNRQSGSHLDLKLDLLQAKDLDLFGRHSLFQYICTAGTIYGQDQLAEWLGCPDKNIDEIKSRQQAVAELASKSEFSLRFESAARSLRCHDYATAQKIMQDFFQSLSDRPDQGQHPFSQALPDPPKQGQHPIFQALSNQSDQDQHSGQQQKQHYRPAYPCLVRWFSRIFPVITITFLSAAVLNIHRQATVSCTLLFMTLQLLLALLTYHRHNKLLAPVYKMNQTIAPYRRLMELIEQESFDSPYLRALQKSLTDSSAIAHDSSCPKNSAHSKTASEAFKELEKIADSVVIRHNLFALILCNSLFLYDFHCMQRFAAWKQNYQHLILPWLTAAGKVEAFISLGVISRTKNTYSMPILSDQARPVLSGTCIQHPLIDESVSVGNDFDLMHQTCIITGSNMSGKTTFMRSIGMNLVLAYAGGYCTAARLHAGFMHICTSMRTQDNVSEGISTFYAELLRIKKMADMSRQRIPMISLIDEIYKGTNSKDRIYAAIETVRKLSQPYALTMITTHDLELCDLESDEQIDAENYHFSEYYEQNQIRFDYKIRQGRSQTANARYLLQMAGILD